MCSSFWTAVLIAVIGGSFGGLVAPLVVAARQRANWRAQRAAELRYDVFCGAMAALAALASDSLDLKVQSEKAVLGGLTRKVEFRPTTAEALELYRGLVPAHFSQAAADHFEAATQAPISVATVPNIEFESCRRAAADAMLAELGLSRRHAPNS